ncbi:hypothetical protein [Paraburkholderia sp. UYCP14C]|uniref:hypothetical protein n=1 Tax=Paraburkholderia sp. UYCP14C TaxID=2511130 RepID=UPI0026BAE3EE|nr:hypothetical protein [Paraburkholderia sp. UYCP14C]
MDRETFIRPLTDEGFPDPLVVTREAGVIEEHTHPFEAKGLIVAGEMHLRVGGEARL